MCVGVWGGGGMGGGDDFHRKIKDSQSSFL